MRRSPWGEHGSLWNFLVNRTPGKPTAHDFADVAMKAHLELERQERLARRMFAERGMRWDDVTRDG